jgi:hypothetical membrane protein
MKVLIAVLLLCSANVQARQPNWRATRDTGMVLTALGAANLVLVGIFGGVYAAHRCQSDCSYYNSDFNHAVIGLAGMSASAFVGTGLLSVGIPLVALARPDGARVELTSNGLRGRF